MDVLGASATTYTFHDLPTCKSNISFSVAAVNKAGIGKHSDRLFAGDGCKGISSIGLHNEMKTIGVCVLIRSSMLL